MVIRLGLILAVFCVSGCKKDSTPETAGPTAIEAPSAKPVAANPVAAKPAADAAAPAEVNGFACERNDDCVVSCVEKGDCCGQLCQCSNAYHKRELEAARKANSETCGKLRRDCPVASCPAPTGDLVPACVDKKCTAVEVPHYSPDKRYTCKTDDECVVTKVLPNNCCGQVCFASAVYHKDELTAIEAVNARRCTEELKPECPMAKCAKPATAVKAVCRKGTCEGRQVPWGQQ